MGELIVASLRGNLPAFTSIHTGGTFPVIASREGGSESSTPECKNPLKSATNLAGRSDIQGVESRRWPVKDYSKCIT